MAAKKERRGNHEGTITKLAEGRYMGKIMIGYNANGKANRKSVYGSTRSEVSEKLIALAHQHNEGTYSEPSKITLGDWLKAWLQNYKSTNLKPRTYDTYETQINYHIIPIIGNIFLKDLKPLQLQQFYNQKFNKGTGLSPATIIKIHNIINAALKQAQINGFIKSTPCLGIQLPSLNQKQVIALTKEEQARFMEAAKQSLLYNAFSLAFDTGLRMGELLALTWEDIDLKNNYINVNKNLIYVKDRQDGAKTSYKYEIQKTPKTKAGIRKIPLTNRAAKMLSELKLKGALQNRLVFPSMQGTYIDPSNFERAFVSVSVRAGISKCNSHTMRHTFATRCFECGIPVKVVSKWLGHSKVSHTMDIYTHVLPDMDKDSIYMLESLENKGSAGPIKNPFDNPMTMKLHENR